MIHLCLEEVNQQVHPNKYCSIEGNVNLWYEGVKKLNVFSIFSVFDI